MKPISTHSNIKTKDLGDPITVGGVTLPAGAPAPQGYWQGFVPFFAQVMMEDLVTDRTTDRQDEEVVYLAAAFGWVVLGWEPNARWLDAANLRSFLSSLVHRKHREMAATLRATAMGHVRFARSSNPEIREGNLACARFMLALEGLVLEHRRLWLARVN